MIASIQATLADSPDNIWQMLLQRDAFIYYTRGMISFTGAEEWPELFYEGQEVEARMWFFNFIPGWKHKLRVIRVDHEQMELASQEEGGVIRKWNHRKWVERKSERSCVYVDEIDIDAGVFTFFIWLYAHVFYRYRQRRMAKLVAKQSSATTGTE